MKLEYCKMVVFKSCRNCTPPKRYPGCHAHCEAYKVERAEYDRLKAKEDKETKIRHDIYNQRSIHVAKAMKNHRR